MPSIVLVLVLDQDLTRYFKAAGSQGTKPCRNPDLSQIPQSQLLTPRCRVAPFILTNAIIRPNDPSVVCRSL